MIGKIYCVWCRAEVQEFWDKSGLREFYKTGLCQKCQDETFSGEEGSSAVNVLHRRSGLGPLVPVIQICPDCGKVNVQEGDGHSCQACAETDDPPEERKGGGR